MCAPADFRDEPKTGTAERVMNPGSPLTFSGRRIRPKWPPARRSHTKSSPKHRRRPLPAGIAQLVKKCLIKLVNEYASSPPHDAFSGFSSGNGIFRRKMLSCPHRTRCWIRLKIREGSTLSSSPKGFRQSRPLPAGNALNDAGVLQSAPNPASAALFFSLIFDTFHRPYALQRILCSVPVVLDGIWRQLSRSAPLPCEGQAALLRFAQEIPPSSLCRLFRRPAG